MSDKELDQLFHAKLDQLEEKPSAELWKEIQAGINHKTRRTTFSWFYRIAASILLVGVGVWLMMPKRPAMQAAVKTRKEIKLPVVEKAVEKQMPNVEKVATRTAIVKSPAVNKIVLRHKNAASQQLVATKPVVIEHAQGTNVQSQTLIAGHPEIPDLPLASAVFPVESLSEPIFKDGQGMEATEIQMTGIERRQTKVKNLGDLLNLVIAKVDKREDKIIEFDKHDEEANITCINLGIVKIKREK
ncbi:MAG: hypothetical protein ACOH2A_11540 [Sphingobacteriaceae bacterium]